MTITDEVFDGCYEAKRASALSGVPISTVYSWNRSGLVVPSVSSTKLMLWSYADLVTLRLAYWLRQPKRDLGVPATRLAEVRSAFRSLGDDIWTGDPGDYRSRIFVDQSGQIILDVDGGHARIDGQGVLPHLVDLLGPFDSDEGQKGPDLVRPRRHLRIVPGKVAGEPHAEHSRLTTLTLAALRDRGFALDAIVRMYPDEDPVAIREGIELEEQLAA